MKPKATPTYINRTMVKVLVRVERFICECLLSRYLFFCLISSCMEQILLERKARVYHSLSLDQIIKLLWQQKGFPGGSVVKKLSAMQETRVQSLSQEMPWRKKWQPTPVFLPRKSYGEVSLAGCPGSQESDTTLATKQ